MANETKTISVNVRIPDDLHANVTKAAKAARRSLNAQILFYMEQGSARDGFPLDPGGDSAEKKAPTSE